jgi:hypothetical protein
MEGARLYYAEGMHPPSLVTQACRQFEVDINALFDLFADEHLVKQSQEMLSDAEIQEVFCMHHNLNFNDIDNKTKKELEKQLKKHIEEDKHPNMPHVRKFQGVVRVRRHGYPSRTEKADREVWDNLAWLPSPQLLAHIVELRTNHYQNDDRPLPIAA